MKNYDFSLFGQPTTIKRKGVFLMLAISSKIEGQTYKLDKLEQQLKPLGYTIGGNWDYDHGSFDYKIDDREGYQFLRVPFKVLDGQLDSQGTTVKLGTPYLLSHEYQKGLDDYAHVGNANASVNQFSEPKDPDAQFPQEYIELGKKLVKELEKVLRG